jgi:hypothetical protein
MVVLLGIVPLNLYASFIKVLLYVRVKIQNSTMKGVT